VQNMRRLLPMYAAIGAITLAEVSLAAYLPAQPSASNPAAKPAAAMADMPPMPPLPSGESTILGGAIRKIDPVLDQFSLHISGERPMTIQYDQRTQIFRNGVKIPLSDLKPADHAAVQTALDGTHVFAESIHILSQAPEGQCQGVVQGYDVHSGKLEIDSGLSPNSVSLFVPGDTPIVRVGQPEFTAARSGQPDLIRGTLVAVTFTPDVDGRAVARHITVLAVPGSRFIFGGSISYLNLASGSLVLIDSRDGKSYQIHFSPNQFPSSAKLHIGDNVTVTASYESSRYVATTLTIN
jgi:hypothetical protein